jgi:hypothetical protein
LTHISESTYLQFAVRTDAQVNHLHAGRKEF